MLDWLRGSKVPQQVVARLAGDSGRESAAAASARRAVASLSWVQGISLAQIEQGMVATFDSGRRIKDPGPILQAMRRAADVIGAVIDIAQHVHPTADLGDLQETLPARQELGIVAGHVPIARQLDVHLDRNVYLALKKAELTNAAAIRMADESTVLDCVDNDHDLLVKLLAAAKAAEEEAVQPSLDDILPLTD